MSINALSRSLPAIGTGGNSHRRAKQFAAVVLGTLFLASSSYITVPMIPVPVTMQTFAVIMVGALYGWRLGSVTIAAWILEGALGMPVFAGGTGGLLVFMGPTAGYILSWPLVGAMVGFMVERGCNGSHPVRAFAAMIAAQTVCLLVGAAWLSAFVGAHNAVMAGIAPFIPGEVMKAALAVATLSSWQAARRHLGKQ